MLGRSYRWAGEPYCYRPITATRRATEAMADITITSTAEREFEVQVGDEATSHRVTVPETLIEELELPRDDLERVVRESFEFLLEREPPSSILSEFSLDEISRYFPEYREELPRRLS